jgi:hypothetical protein
MKNIREAGRTPIERDSLYGEVDSGPEPARTFIPLAVRN